MTDRTKIYVASRASVPERATMWRRLRDAEGWNIISSWIDEAGEGETGNFAELWTRIESEIRSCDALVFYVESSDLPLKGALVEAGMALALGKPVVIATNDVALDARDLRPLGSWAMHPGCRIVNKVHAAMSMATRVK